VGYGGLDEEFQPFSSLVDRLHDEPAAWDLEGTNGAHGQHGRGLHSLRGVDA